MPRRRCEHWVPCSLAIVVSVHIYETWRNQFTVGVYFALTWADLTAYLGDLITADSDITGVAGCTRAINDGSVSNDNVVHGGKSRWC